MEQKKDIYKFSRFLYILEAALEYFVALSVGTVYLAKLASYIGLSDSVTGILSSFVSLGCGFQLIAIFLANKRPVKRWVTLLHIVSQALFAMIYLIPVFDFSTTAKTVLFVGSLLAAHIIHNAINSPKINWYMSLVDNDKRGRFTANKEIVSLISGMAFSYGLGAVIDHFEAAGDMRTAFIICGIGVFGLMVLHSLTLIFSKEKPAPKEEAKESVGQSIKELIKNKDLFKIILISVLWNIGNYATTSFMGTYLTKELAFTMTFASIVTMVGSLVRALFSQPMGRFADKYSFSKMLIVCFSIAAVGFGFNIFTVPSNGKVFYLIYHVLHCIAMAGINSATINLIYDYVEPKQRTQALALKQTFAGFAGFLITLIMSPLVALIQKNGNRIFGLPLYAQQVTSIFSLVVVLLIIVYMVFVVRKIKRKDLSEPAVEQSQPSEALEEVAADAASKDTQN
ncbi:MAG: MFS transporter [Clostridia bacterium]|nr:MFS transporter [Clostridia bacterium]